MLRDLGSGGEHAVDGDSDLIECMPRAIGVVRASTPRQRESHQRSYRGNWIRSESVRPAATDDGCWGEHQQLEIEPEAATRNVLGIQFHPVLEGHVAAP